MKRVSGRSIGAMSVSILEILGLDPEDIEWHDLAQCRGMDRELWFDKYEADEKIAMMTDEVCLSCPVLQECLTAGIDNGEHGCWGGVFLSSGKPDKNRNTHKTQQVWKELKDRIGDII